MGWGNERVVTGFARSRRKDGSGWIAMATSTALLVAALAPAAGVIAALVAAGPAQAAGAAGSMSSWGANGAGQLGNGVTSTGPTPVPVAVSGLSNASLTIAAGGSHSLAVKTDRTIVAWGDNGAGELGNGNPASNSPVPVPVSGSPRSRRWPPVPSIRWP